MTTKIEPVSYLIIKIGNSVFSTTMYEKPTHILDLKRNTETKNIWLMGEFTETRQHKKLKEPIPFELNIYTINQNLNKKDIQTTLKKE